MELRSSWTFTEELLGGGVLLGACGLHLLLFRLTMRFARTGGSLDPSWAVGGGHDTAVSAVSV